MSPLDVAACIVLALALVRGLAIGMVREAFSVAALAAACIAVRFGSGPASEWLLANALPGLGPLGARILAGAARLLCGFGGDALPTIELCMPGWVHDAARGLERDETRYAQFAELFDHPIRAITLWNGRGDDDLHGLRRSAGNSFDAYDNVIRITLADRTRADVADIIEHFNRLSDGEPQNIADVPGLRAVQLDQIRSAVERRRDVDSSRQVRHER